MHRISLIVLLAAALFVSGCYTKAYVREMNNAQQTQSAQTNTNQMAGQANK
jgi:PBP1b-binding outer membrane lipoprotein LpoB